MHIVSYQVAKFQHQQRKYKVAENQFLFFDFFCLPYQKTSGYVVLILCVSLHCFWMLHTVIITDQEFIFQVMKCPNSNHSFVLMELEASQKKHNHSASKNCCTLLQNIIITNQGYCQHMKTQTIIIKEAPILDLHGFTGCFVVLIKQPTFSGVIALLGNYFADNQKEKQNTFLSGRVRLLIGGSILVGLSHHTFQRTHVFCDNWGQSVIGR